jgi:hypothetical protein
MLIAFFVGLQPEIHHVCSADFSRSTRTDTLPVEVSPVCSAGFSRSTHADTLPVEVSPVCSAGFSRSTHADTLPVEVSRFVVPASAGPRVPTLHRSGAARLLCRL